MQCLTFQYSNKYHHMQAAEFLTDFFNDANVREAFQVRAHLCRILPVPFARAKSDHSVDIYIGRLGLTAILQVAPVTVTCGLCLTVCPPSQVVTGDATWAPITGQVTSIDSAVVSANATSMDMFDRLKDAPEPILRSGTWDIVKCFQDERDGFIIQDRLRELILAAEDSENDGLVAEADQQQFLWLIFEHLVLGGSMNQFEDSAEVYVDLAKRLYKDLVTCASALRARLCASRSASFARCGAMAWADRAGSCRPQKNCATGEIEVRSAVYKATSMETDGGTKLFPVGNRNSFCYVTTDPSRSVCKCFYHAFVPHW